MREWAQRSPRNVQSQQIQSSRRNDGSSKIRGKRSSRHLRLAHTKLNPSHLSPNTGEWFVLSSQGRLKSTGDRLTQVFLLFSDLSHITRSVLLPISPTSPTAKPAVFTHCLRIGPKMQQHDYRELRTDAQGLCRVLNLVGG